MYNKTPFFSNRVDTVTESCISQQTVPGAAKANVRFLIYLMVLCGVSWEASDDIYSLMNDDIVRDGVDSSVMGSGGRQVTRASVHSCLHSHQLIDIALPYIFIYSVGVYIPRPVTIMKKIQDRATGNCPDKYTILKLLKKVPLRLHLSLIHI